MKIRLLTIKPKKILTFILITIFSFSISFLLINSSRALGETEVRFNYTVLLDAGHGGRDNGVSGASGTSEAPINLEIVRKLETELRAIGFKVVLTRTNKNGLYEENVDNYKLSDMEKRKEIIENSNADLIVSIHQNSYPNSHAVGAQVFCLEKGTESENFANSIQTELKKLLPNARETISFGDYYLLKCSNMPSVIVECGYLTNPEEEKLLQDEKYQERVAYAITCGIIRYFGVEKVEAGSSELVWAGYTSLQIIKYML